MSRSSSITKYLNNLKQDDKYKECPCKYSHIEGKGRSDVETRLCEFADFPRYTYSQYVSKKYNIPDPFTARIGTPDKEFIDYLHEMPIIVLPSGTLLTHTTKIKDLVDSKGEIIPDNACWWKSFYPGQLEYKGAWFTFGKSIGPSFGLRLTYRLTSDISLLYIPNTYANMWRAKDSEYFDMDNIHYNDKRYAPSYTVEDVESGEDEDDSNTSFKIYYAGSHLIQGVRNWKAKGYEKITHEYFADKLAIKLANLGFNGYISCDECEVYLTHDIMKRCIVEPEEVWVEKDENKRALETINKHCSLIKSKGLTMTSIPNR